MICNYLIITNYNLVLPWNCTDLVISGHRKSHRRIFHHTVPALWLVAHRPDVSLAIANAPIHSTRRTYQPLSVDASGRDKAIVRGRTRSRDFSRTFFRFPLARQRDVNMAGEVSSPGARRRQRQPRPAWYSTPSAKIKEQTPRHTIVETFLTLALPRAQDRQRVWKIKGNSADDGGGCCGTE